MKILIIEDDAWFGALLSQTLEVATHETMVVPHAPAAIVAIDDFSPDVIILDLLLTGSTGFALLHELQSYVDTSVLPIIVCSSLVSDIDQNDLKAYGVRRVLNKADMHPDDVVAAVRSVTP